MRGGEWWEVEGWGGGENERLFVCGGEWWIGGRERGRVGCWDQGVVSSPVSQ